MSPLAGRRILVTRPRELAEGLASALEREGAQPVRYPAIEIADLEDTGLARALLARAATFDLAVFVSPSAVRKAFALHATPWPSRVAAVGEGTRRELRGRGLTGVIAPEGRADSEALLALPELRSLAGRAVLVVRGVGGRELLGESLAARGARVTFAECYRRVPTDEPPPAGALDAACANSAEALEILVARLGRDRLGAIPVFVPHARVAERARALGLERAIVAGPGDAQVIAALVAYFGAAK
ncbi:MAG: uroporphyrinogen-III synthase [Burkholderiales bacterium]